MPFRLLRGETAAALVRRAASEEIEKITEDLSQRPLDGRNVHEARKRTKKLRALLRLVRSAAPDTYTAENRFFRDAARSLSDARDADVLIETAERLAERYARAVPSEDWSALLAALRTRREQLPLQDLSAVAGEWTALLDEARQRVAEWPLDEFEYEALLDQLTALYRKGRTGADRAAAAPRTDDLHEWRKQVKYHWHQMRLLRPLWRPVVTAQTNELKRLSDLLGDDHDVAVLRQTISNEPHAFPPPWTEDALRRIARRERRRQLRVIVPLGQKLFVDKPKVFRRRYGRFLELVTKPG